MCQPNTTSAADSKRSSKRLASRPKCNLTMEEQATQLLMKKCGTLAIDMEVTVAAKEKFITQFTEPLLDPTVGGFRDCFGLPEDGDTDVLSAVALEADCCCSLG